MLTLTRKIFEDIDVKDANGEMIMTFRVTQIGDKRVRITMNAKRDIAITRFKDEDTGSSIRKWSDYIKLGNKLKGEDNA